MHPVTTTSCITCTTTVRAGGAGGYIPELQMLVLHRELLFGKYCRQLRRRIFK
jgi:hypothetical protein